MKSSISDISILHFTKSVSFTTFPFNLQVYVDIFFQITGVTDMRMESEQK